MGSHPDSSERFTKGRIPEHGGTRTLIYHGHNVSRGFPLSEPVKAATLEDGRK